MKKVFYTALLFAPSLAFADTNLNGISQLVSSIGGIVAKIIPLMFAIAIVYFFWGLVQFLRGAGDPKMHDAGKAHMIYGVIAIAVMVSIYGLVAWLQTNLGVTTVTNLPLPTVSGLPTSNDRDRSSQ